MATVPAPTPFARARLRASSRLRHNGCFLLSVRKLQFPRALSAPPPDVALPFTHMPRPPASPGPSLPVCVSDPKAVGGGGTVGGAAASFSSASNSSSSSGGRDDSSSGNSGRAAPSDLICLQPGELTTKRARTSLSSALLRTRLGVPLGLAGFGGWREGSGFRRCLRSTGARATPAPRVSVRRAELAFRPPAVVR